MLDSPPKMAHKPKNKNRWSMLSRHSTVLADIPEASPAPSPPRPAPARTFTPGPNAFAQQAMRRRDLTPPTAIHPAGFDIPLTAIHPAFRLGFDINAPVARSNNGVVTPVLLAHTQRIPWAGSGASVLPQPSTADHHCLRCSACYRAGWPRGG